MGWIGDSQQVRYTLEIMKADKDEDGRFLIYNEAPVSFMGQSQEVVINDKIDYSIGGKKAGLARLMSSTSYGVKIRVI